MTERSERNLTVFGEETEFDGLLEFTDSLVIAGKFHGTISATGDLKIERGAVCDVDVMQATSIVVSGKVLGNIEAKERVELCAGSDVRGDLKAARLRIADGVEFEGEITMVDELPDSNVFDVASEEYKKALVTKTIRH